MHAFDVNSTKWFTLQCGQTHTFICAAPIANTAAFHRTGFCFCRIVGSLVARTFVSSVPIAYNGNIAYRLSIEKLPAALTQSRTRSYINIYVETNDSTDQNGRSRCGCYSQKSANEAIRKIYTENVKHIHIP